jgi:hypothetical protein
LHEASSAAVTASSSVLSWNHNAMAEKPAVLIIGGLGYIGRFLALHIQQENLASEVRIVDKVLPQLAWLAPEFEEACSQDKFMQADASKDRECCAPSPITEYASCRYFCVLTDKFFRKQNPSLAYSIAPMVSSGIMCSTVVERRGTRRRMRYTKCGRWH